MSGFSRNECVVCSVLRANGCGVMTSSVVSITVNPNPLVSVTPLDQIVCVGGIATLTAQITNGSGDYSFQWEYSEDGSVQLLELSARSTLYEIVPTSVPGTL